MSKSFGSRAIALTMGAALVFGGTVVAPHFTAVAAPADGAATSNKGGTLTILNPDGKVTADGLLWVSGTGFEDRVASAADLYVKIDNQSANISTTDTGDDVSVSGGNFRLSPSKLPGTDGTTLFAVRLDGKLAAGNHTVRLLGQNPQVTTAVSFTVDPAAKAAAVASGTFTSGTALAVSAAGFAANGTLNATVDGAAAQFDLGRSFGKADSVTADGNGAWNGNLVVTAKAGESKNVVISDGTNSANFTVVGIPVVTWAVGVNRGAYPGGSFSMELSNLPDGASITSITAGGKTLTSAAVDAASGKAAVPVSIPNDETLVGKYFVVNYTVNGQSYTYVTPRQVTESDSEFGTASYDSKKTMLNTGLYQSAYNPVNNTVVVALANWDASTTTHREGKLYELDPQTLEVKKEVDLKAPDGSILGGYGVGVDTSNGDIWVGHTRGASGKTGVSLYDKDLNLKKQWLDPTNTVQHARDIVVDPTTHKAYASAANRTNDLKIYDPTKDAPVGSIPLNDTVGAAMGLSFDAATRTIYTVGLNSPVVGAINIDQVVPVAATNDATQLATNPNKAGITTWNIKESGLAQGTTTAYDADNNVLYIVGQGNNSLLAFDLTTHTVTKRVYTGDQPVYVVYDKTEKKLWVTNFSSGTTVVVDPVTDAVTARFQTGTQTNSLSTDGKGNVFVGVKNNDNGQDAFWRFTAKTPASSDNGTGSTNNQNQGSGEQKATEAPKGFFANILSFLSANKLIVGVVAALLAIGGAVGAGITSGAIVLPPMPN
ncbi:MAG: hypothetical protein Q3962_05850 [Corynebacterium sp.]|nr:hypothetical protein [Corynebacterium sp.]